MVGLGFELAVYHHSRTINVPAMVRFYRRIMKLPANVSSTFAKV